MCCRFLQLASFLVAWNHGRSLASAGCLTSDRSPPAADRVFVDTGRTRRNVCFCRELVALSSILPTLTLPATPGAPVCHFLGFGPFQASGYWLTRP